MAEEIKYQQREKVWLKTHSESLLRPRPTRKLAKSPVLLFSSRGLALAVGLLITCPQIRPHRRVPTDNTHTVRNSHQTMEAHVHSCTQTHTYSTHTYSAQTHTHIPPPHTPHTQHARTQVPRGWWHPNRQGPRGVFQREGMSVTMKCFAPCTSHGAGGDFATAPSCMRPIALR